MADSRERYNDHEEAFRTAVNGILMGLWTALPCVVEDVNFDAMTCTLQPTIQGKMTDQTGTIIFVNMPLLLDVPFFYPGGGGLTATFPFDEGDECLAVFSARCIDSWWQNGGIQPPAEFRVHDLSDAFAFVGFRSQPRVLPNISQVSAQIRTDDGLTFIEVMKVGGIVNIVAPGATNITTPVLTVNGSQIITENLTVDVDASIGGISSKNHLHDEVTSGTDNTGAPVP